MLPRLGYLAKTRRTDWALTSRLPTSTWWFAGLLLVAEHCDCDARPKGTWSQPHITNGRIGWGKMGTSLPEIPELHTPNMTYGYFEMSGPEAEKSVAAPTKVPGKLRHGRTHDKCTRQVHMQCPRAWKSLIDR